MSEVTYHSVLELAQQLSEREQLSLISQLATHIQIQNKSTQPSTDLFGKYAPDDNPNADEDVDDAIREIRSEWQDNLKDLTDDD